MGQAGETGETPIRILLVDDQHLLLDSFARLLELEGRGMQVVGAAADGQQALATLERLEGEDRLPAVVLMDVRMPRMDGPTATARIVARWPGVRVMMLTTFDDDESVFAGLQAGAKGYLLKDATADELIGAIHAVHRGESPLQPSVAAKLVARLAGRQETPLPAQPGAPRAATPVVPSSDRLVEELTEREHEILAHLARGATNREISEALFITEGTVKNHVSNILSKLGLRDRTQAALWAREHGLG
jgi:DNA-binding NarL/FixJ family response regulator